MSAQRTSEVEQEEIIKAIESLRALSGQEKTIAALEAVLALRVQSPARDIAWSPIFLAAAVRVSYSLAELQKTAGDRDGALHSSAEDVSRLLDQSLAVAGLPKDEATRYVLNDKARHAVLLDAKARGLIDAALEPVSNDLGSADGVLNRLIHLWEDGEAPPWDDTGLDAMSAAEMENAVRAASLLVDIWPELRSSRDEMRRRLDLEDIIAPLRLLIGKVGPVGAGGGPDTFVGRGQQLLRLYDHVGVVPPSTLFHRLSRGAKTLAEYVVGAPHGALIVHAIGGMGKSALISKFVLDHASESNLLFAYLDFDRSTLQRATTGALLVEVARQVGLQLSERRYGAETASNARAQLAELRANLRSDLSEGARQTSVNYADVLKHVVNSLQGGPSLLIVLDTLERVQGQVKSIQDMLRELGLFSGGWDRLRVVGCSRIDVPELREKKPRPEPIELSTLTLEEAEQLAGAILSARNSNRTFASEVMKVIGRASRGYPLFVRALVAHVSAAQLDENADFIKELKSTKGKAALVATVLYARFSDRIELPGSAETFKAALSLRVVTLPLLTIVLRELGVTLSDEKIAEAFASLRKDETFWIAARGPEELHWRPELRALLLGCIRDDDVSAEGAWLRRVAGVVLDRQRNLLGEADTKADLLYYTLLAGNGVEAADRFWQPTGEFRQDLIDAPGDFPPESVESRYLRLVANNQRPSVEDLDILPPAAGWRLSWHAAPSLAAPSAAGVEPRVLKLLDRGLSLPAGSEKLEERMVALLAKTGRWKAARKRLSRNVIRWPVDRADLLGWMVHAIPNSGSESLDEVLFSGGPIPRRELWADMLHLAEFLVNEANSAKQSDTPVAVGERLVGALIVARIRNDKTLFDTLDPLIGELHSSRLSSENLASNAIMVGAFGNRAVDWAAEEVYNARFLSAVSSHQLLMIQRALRIVSLKGYGDFERAMPGELLEAADEMKTARAWTDSLIIRAALDALWTLRHEWRDSKARWAFFRDFFAVRNPEWIEPLGYIIADGHGEILRSAIEELVARRQLYTDASLRSAMANLHDPTDTLQSLDEAGALGLCLAIIREGLAEKTGFLPWLLETIRFSPPSNSNRDEMLGLINRFDAWQVLKGGLDSSQLPD